MFNPFANRRSRRTLLIEINPYQVLVAGINRPLRGPAQISFAAEFPVDDDAALRQWLGNRSDLRKTWMAAVCSVVPKHGILQRENLQAGDLTSPGWMANFIEEQQQRKSSASSSVPFLRAQPEGWTFCAVDAAAGTPLPAAAPPQPALLVGLAKDELRKVQQRVLDLHLMPLRLEPALLPLFGALQEIMAERPNSQAVVVFVIREEVTTVYILGKEGVHTPVSVQSGLRSIVQRVREEFAVKDDAAALHLLEHPDIDLIRTMPKILRRLGGELRPAIDSYEMTTGQPVGEIYCAYLPPALAWLAGPLVKLVGRELLAFDWSAWMEQASLQPLPGAPAFGPHWLGALSLAAHLPETGAGKSERAEWEGAGFPRPWHVDCRQTTELASQGAGFWPFATTAVAALLMVFAVGIGVWRAYLNRTLTTDTEYWEQQMSEHRQLVAELTTTVAQLKERSARLGQAHDLMQTPYQVSEFLLSLGRTLAPHMRIDRIEESNGRVTIAGSLLEPAEEASISLGRYIQKLRQTPEIGGLFASITTTSMQRTGETDVLAFEIALRFRPESP